MNFCEPDQFDQRYTDTLTVMKRARAAAAISALSLLIAACGGASSTTEAAAPVSSDAAPASSDLAESTVEFEGVFNTVSGTQIDLGALEGQDTVLWFWAPW